MNAFEDVRNFVISNIREKRENDQSKLYKYCVLVDQNGILDEVMVV